MAFRRRGGRSFYFQARTPTGRRQLCTYTDKPKLAESMERMWETLAAEHRAWDLLHPVLEGQRALGELYDAWEAAKRAAPKSGWLAETRRLLNDRDLEPLVAEFETVYRRQVEAVTANTALTHIRFLLPADEPYLDEAGQPRHDEQGRALYVHHPCPVSRVTAAWLTERLYAYPAESRNTLRRVHSHWSVFFEHLTRVHGLFPRNPMEHVERPPEEKKPIQFYEREHAERIVQAQPDSARRAFYAIAYGAAVESSVTLGLTRADVWERTREIRSAGTKTHTRDRVSIVTDWAWPYIAEHVRTLLPTARLFPAWWQPTDVWRFHKETVEDLHARGLLPAVYTLHCARHHWAVTYLRAGTPLAVVQRQLGHSTAKLTLDTYGAFIPTAADRAHWEEQVRRAEERRREAGEASGATAATGTAGAATPDGGDNPE